MIALHVPMHFIFFRMQSRDSNEYLKILTVAIAFHCIVKTSLPPVVIPGKLSWSHQQMETQPHFAICGVLFTFIHVNLLKSFFKSYSNPHHVWSDM